MEQYIPETDVAFAVNDLVEAMPQTLFLKLEEQLGWLAYHPKIMLKIILCAYTQRVFSDRKIGFLLDDSYRMRWLANHEQVSYRTINRFQSQETTAHLLAEAFVLFRCQLITNILMAQKSKRMPINSVLSGAKQQISMKLLWINNQTNSIKPFIKKKSCLI